MKKIILIFPIWFLFSCEVEGKLTRDKIDTVAEISSDTHSGNFEATSGITVTGSAEIYLDNNQNKLALKNFSISSGPDLKVYLSKTNTPTEYINLGNLSATTTYIIPPQIDLKEYKYILIHCQQFNHLFAVAKLISK